MHRPMICRKLRTKDAPEAYIDIMQRMYQNSDCIVRTTVGDTKSIFHHLFPSPSEYNRNPSSARFGSAWHQTASEAQQSILPLPVFLI